MLVKSIHGGMSMENKVGKHIKGKVRDVCGSDCWGFAMAGGYWRPHQ